MLHTAMIWMVLLGLMNFVRSHMAVIAARHERDANEVTNHLTQLQQQAALRNPSCFDFEQIVRFGI